MLFLYGMGYLLLAIIAHCLLMRLPLPGSAVAKFVLAGTIIGTAFGIHGYILAGIDFSLVVGLLCYACGCELYLFLFTMITTSISANILCLLLTGSQTKEKINDLYVPEEMVQCRLVRLRDVGLIEEKEKELRLSAKGERLVAGFRILRQVFRHPEPNDISSRKAA